MSTELKLPSFIYEENPTPPTNLAQSSDMQLNSEVNNNLRDEIVNDYLSDINRKVVTCLNNQKNIIEVLVRLEKKLEEFQ